MYILANSTPSHELQECIDHIDKLRERNKWNKQYFNYKTASISGTEETPTSTIENTISQDRGTFIYLFI